MLLSHLFSSAGSGGYPLSSKIAWRSGVVAARKRRFALACCKGSAIQAVACVQIGPRNESVRGFLAQEACMSVCLLNVDPASPQFKAGAHLCREVSQGEREEGIGWSRRGSGAAAIVRIWVVRSNVSGCGDSRLADKNVSCIAAEQALEETCSRRQSRVPGVGKSVKSRCCYVAKIQKEEPASRKRLDPLSRLSAIQSARALTSDKGHREVGEHAGQFRPDQGYLLRPLLRRNARHVGEWNKERTTSSPGTYRDPPPRMIPAEGKGYIAEVWEVAGCIFLPRQDITRGTAIVIREVEVEGGGVHAMGSSRWCARGRDKVGEADQNVERWSAPE